MELVKKKMYDFDKEVEQRIKQYNLEYRKYFYNKPLGIVREDLTKSRRSFDDLDLPKTKHTDDNTLDLFNIIKLTSFNAKHLFHDGVWWKYTKSNFICELENDELMYCNTINVENIMNTEFVKFVNAMSKMKHVKISYHNFGFDCDQVKWVVIKYSVKNDL